VYCAKTRYFEFRGLVKNLIEVVEKLGFLKEAKVAVR